MPLTAGTRLGPYEVLAPIGAGGSLVVVQEFTRELERLVPTKK